MIPLGGVLYLRALVLYDVVRVGVRDRGSMQRLTEVVAVGERPVQLAVRAGLGARAATPGLAAAIGVSPVQQGELAAAVARVSPRVLEAPVKQPATVLGVEQTQSQYYTQHKHKQYAYLVINASHLILRELCQLI